MPFIGQDWRGPGQHWVRTANGWEKSTIPGDCGNMENYNGGNRFGGGTRSGRVCSANFGENQPHVFVQRNQIVSLSDAIRRLQMKDAICDVRRFAFVCKVLELIFRHKLSCLSGTAQKMVFDILKRMVSQVLISQNNIHVARDLLQKARVSLKMARYSHVGGAKLWEGHVQLTEQMLETINAMEIRKRAEDGRPMLCDLPDDCLRRILHCLSDATDIMNVGLTECRLLTLTEERVLWKDLCLYQFNERQLYEALETEYIDNLTTSDLKGLYGHLMKRLGPRVDYAETLELCRGCSALFWGKHGHPCLAQEDALIESLLVSPEMCLEFFET